MMNDIGAHNTLKGTTSDVKKKWYVRFWSWLCGRFVALWHYLWAFLSNDPKNDITFLIFAAASITSIILSVKYMGHFTDNDIKALGILQGGGSLPQMVKTGVSVVDSIKAKI